MNLDNNDDRNHEERPKKDTTSNLYRLPEEVHTFIMSLVDWVERLPTSIEQSKITKVRLALTRPIDVLISEPAENTNVLIESTDPLKEATFKNTLAVIRRSLESEFNGSNDEIKEKVNRVLNRIPTDI